MEIVWRSADRLAGKSSWKRRQLRHAPLKAAVDRGSAAPQQRRGVAGRRRLVGPTGSHIPVRSTGEAKRVRSSRTWRLVRNWPPGGLGWKAGLAL